MINESNFNDIRRNFILAAILLILSLLYWTEIRIEQLLIFKFDAKWDWAKVSPYFDILIILLMFLIYTLLRYWVYAKDQIESNKYNQLLLVEITKNTRDLQSSEWGSLIQEILFLKWWILDKKYTDWLWLYLDSSEPYWHCLMLGQYYDNNGKQDVRKFYIPKDIKSLKIKKNIISFDWAKILFNSNNIIKDLWPWFFNLFFRKEFSDFLWPLFLLIPIVFLLIVHLVRFISKFYCF